MPSTDTVLVIENQTSAPPGLVGRVLDEAAVPYRVVAPNTAELLADTHRWRAIVALGGEMGAYDEHRYPYLRAEKELLARTVADGVPVLGICLGCQLLADALGGRAHLGPDAEIGYRTLQLTEAGARDPVLGRLDGPVFVWHHDTFDLPPGAELLAQTDRYPHAYRLGSALGLQFHPEATPDIIRGWIQTASREQRDHDGIDLASLPRHLDEFGDVSSRASLSILRTWRDTITATIQ